MAVLPTPMMSTRSPIFRCGRRPRTRARRCRCGYVGGGRLAPRQLSSLPLGAPEPTNTASNPCPSSARMLSTGELRRRSTPMPMIMAISSSSTVVRQAERGDVGAHQAAGLAVLLEYGHLVAERHEVVGHRERGAAGADAGDALAVLGLGDLRQPGADVVARDRRPRASGGRWRPASPRRGRGGRPARRAGRRRGRGLPGTRWIRRFTM